MNEATARKLLDLNRLFYQTFALQFSATRGRIQPGVQRVVEKLPLDARVLDVGCGNGELWRFLQTQGYRGEYVGVDFSVELLQEARKRAEEGNGPGGAFFFQADLAKEGWTERLPDGRFDIALAFAVLHHLPGEQLRMQAMRQVHELLKPDARLFLSNWQFLKSERLRNRIQPWERIHLTSEDVEPGDHLLDWRRGGYALRYVHHFSEAELGSLAQATGFRVLDTFYSDGKGGRLGIYQEWGIV